MTRWRRGSGVPGLVCLVALMLAAGHGTAYGQDASPAATPVVPHPGSLAEMLALAPDLQADVYVPAIHLARYTDFAAQFVAVGVERPDRFLVDDEAGRASLGVYGSLALPDGFRDLSEESWLELVGFGPAQIDQVLEVGSSIEPLRLMRGRFDAAALETALTRNGYQALDEGGITIWTVEPTDDMGLSSRIVALGFYGFDDVALLPDGTLIAGARLEAVRAVIAVAAGTAPSLAEQPDVAALLAAAPVDLVSAIILPGGLFAAENSGGPPADLLAGVAPLPAVDLALFGMTPGGPVRDHRQASEATPDAMLGGPPGPAARLVILVGFADPDTAATAAPIIAARLAGMTSLVAQTSFAAMLGEPAVEAVPGLPVVRILTDPTRYVATNWQIIPFVADYAFLSWE